MSAKAANVFLVCACLGTIAIVMAAKAVRSWLPTHTHAPADQVALLTIDPVYLDFGQVWEQPEFAFAIPVANATAKTIHVREVVARCDCSAITPTEFSLAPGQTQLVTVQIDFTRSRWGAEQAVRSFRLPVSFSIDGPQTVLTWTIHGTVLRNPISLSEDQLEYIDGALGVPLEAKTLTAALASGSELAELEAEVRPQGSGTAKVTPLESPDRFLLTVEPSQSLPAGPFSFIVRVSAKDASGQVRIVRDLPVTGTMHRGLTAEPWNIEFGAKPVGESGREFVSLSSETDEPVKVADVLTSGSDVTIEEQPELKRREALVIAVHQRFERPGRNSGWIELRVQCGPNDKAKIVRVVVGTSYYGLAAQSAQSSSVGE